ncbi:MAG TPA: hypothetical protein VJ768_02045, partial [Anaerolineales bacterium]|nr:hypothetical protein [Anaerolineales bacterium]
MAEDYRTERMKILEMIEAGDISPADGLQLLEALTGNEETSSEPRLGPARWEEIPPEDHFEPRPAEGVPGVEVLDAQAKAPPGAGLDSASWRGWWKYIFWTGAGIMVLGAFLLLLAVQFSVAGFWYFCLGIPFIIGFLILLLGVYSRSSRWLHIRIQQPPGEFPSKISVSLPLPIRPAAWFI